MWTRLALWMLRGARQRVECLLLTTPRELREERHLSHSVAEYLADGAAVLLRKRKDDERIVLRCSVQVDD